MTLGLTAPGDASHGGSRPGPCWTRLAHRTCGPGWRSLPAGPHVWACSDPRWVVRSVALQEYVRLVFGAVGGGDLVAVVAPGHESGGAVGGDVVVVAHVAVGDDRVLVGVGLHDREGDRAEYLLGPGHGGWLGGGGEGQVPLVGLEPNGRGGAA